MKLSLPEVLILGSQFDLTCDFVVAKLRSLKCNYLRINTEDLPSSNISLDPVKCRIEINLNQKSYLLSPAKVKSVLFRRPVFVRSIADPTEHAVQTFEREQWAAFVRNLMILDTSTWVNHPASTYYAEHKALQLQIAHRLGFNVPNTLVTNYAAAINKDMVRNSKIVFKGLETVLVREENTETFAFTQFIDVGELEKQEIKSAPVIFQEPITPKIDIRVTVIGNSVFAAAVLASGQGIPHDWRVEKKQAYFEKYELPPEIEHKCIKLIQKLNLNYGAIDLVYAENRYYFLEINPTGEWAWLIDAAGLPIDDAIAGFLAHPRI